MRENKTISFKVCGPAGSGIMLLGEILGAALNEAGYYCIVYPEYPSRIRGGDNNVQVVISFNEEIAPSEEVAALFLLDKNLREAHLNDLQTGGKTYDAEELKFGDLPCVKENKIVKNTVMLGFIWKLLGLKLEQLIESIRSKIDRKNIDINIEAAKAGYEMGDESLGLPATTSKEEILGATGNEIISRAAIQAKVEYASIYPMTPIASLLGFLSKTEIKMITPEDEIFAALSALGASIAGARAMTATSGGGFCLMTEAVGFSAMAEIPLVVILGQRTGPSSGIPTYTSQSDLNFAINPSHGEFPHVVFAPGNLNELFSLTQEAFNMADIYQIPVIVLTDKYLSESRFSCKKADIENTKIEVDRGKRYTESDKEYLRYKLISDGVSERAYAGETPFIVNSYEHDEKGFATEDGKVRQQQMDKRLRKLKDLKGGFEIINESDAQDVIVTWGSTKDAVRNFVNENAKYAHIHVFRPWPFPQELSAKLEKFKRIFVVEGNSTGQLANILGCNTGLKIAKILKDDGRPFYKEDIEKGILNYEQ